MGDSAILETCALALVIATLAVGVKVGSILRDVGLTIGVEPTRTQTPQRINGRFYYLIPEEEYVRTARYRIEADPDYRRMMELTDWNGEWN